MLKAAPRNWRNFRCGETTRLRRWVDSLSRPATAVISAFSSLVPRQRPAWFHSFCYSFARNPCELAWISPIAPLCYLGSRQKSRAATYCLGIISASQSRFQIVQCVRLSRRVQQRPLRSCYIGRRAILYRHNGTLRTSFAERICLHWRQMS